MAKKTPKPARKPRAPLTKRQTRLLEGAMAGGFAFVIGSIFLISSLQSFFLQTNQFASVVSSVLVDLANGDRLANNLNSLTMNPLLVAAAQAKADDMATKSYFAHKSPEGLDSWHWFNQAGYSFQHAGENLAVDFSDSVDVERAWMNSPTHRDNILSGKYSEIGVATAAGYYQGRPTTFVVQMFGTPAQLANAQRTITENSPASATDIAQASRAVDATVLGVASESVAPAQDAVRDAEDSVIAKGEPAVADISAQKQPIGAITRHSTDWQMLATSPSTSMRYAYYFLGFLVLFALAIDTGLEFKWHHRKRAASALALLAIMVCLFFYADKAVFGHAIVAQADDVIQRSL